MRKFSILFLFFICAVSGLKAQEQKAGPKKLNWGIRTGLNLATLNMEKSEVTDPAWRSGFVFGAFFRIRAGNSFSVQPEFLYSSMGGRIMHAISGEARYRFNYISIPILARYQFSGKWAAVAGPQFDFLIQAKQIANEQTTKIDGSYEDNSINATAGMEFWPVRSIGLGVRYIHGLTDISKAESTNIKNQGVQLSLALKL